MVGSWRLRCYQSVCPDEKGRVLVQGDYLSQQDRLQASFVLTLRVLFLLAAGIQFVARFLWKTLKIAGLPGMPL